MKFTEFKKEFKSLYEKETEAMDSLLAGFAKIQKQVNQTELDREKRIEAFKQFPIFMQDLGSQRYFKRDLLKKEMEMLSLAFIAVIDREYADTLIQYN